MASDYKSRDASGRTNKERFLARADGLEAQARRAARRGDHAKAYDLQAEADLIREAAKTRYFPI